MISGSIFFLRFFTFYGKSNVLFSFVMHCSCSEQIHYCHYWKTVLCRVPDTLPSAKYRGTRQSNILPSVALGKILQALGKARRSAKFSRTVTAATYRQILPSASHQALGKICFYFFLKNFAECHPWALGKMFFYFLKTNFAECLLGPALGKDIFAECSPWHSAKYIYIF